MGISVFLGGTLIYFLLQGVGLIVQLQDKFNGQKVPGQGELIAIVCLISLSIFLRMIFVSYEDVAKLAKIQSMNAGTQEWQAILITDMVAEVFCSVVLIGSLYFIYRLESAVALSHAYAPVEKAD